MAVRGGAEVVQDGVGVWAPGVCRVARCRRGRGQAAGPRADRAQTVNSRGIRRGAWARAARSVAGGAGCVRMAVMCHLRVQARKTVRRAPTRVPWRGTSAARRTRTHQTHQRAPQHTAQPIRTSCQTRQRAPAAGNSLPGFVPPTALQADQPKLAQPQHSPAAGPEPCHARPQSVRAGGQAAARREERHGRQVLRGSRGAGPGYLRGLEPGALAAGVRTTVTPVLQQLSCSRLAWFAKVKPLVEGFPGAVHK
jgi:hypothetical protein